MYSDKLLSWNIILRIYQVNAQLFKKKKKDSGEGDDTIS